MSVPTFFLAILLIWALRFAWALNRERKIWKEAAQHFERSQAEWRRRYAQLQLRVPENEGLREMTRKENE